MNQCLPTGLMDEVRKHSRVIEMPTRNDNSLVSNNQHEICYNQIRIEFVILIFFYFLYLQTKLEEYVLEFTESEKISTITTISIFYRQIDDIYFGQLSVEKANPLHHHHHHRTLAEQLHNAKVSSNLLSSSTGSSCLFQLGSKMLTKKYVVI